MKDEPLPRFPASRFGHLLFSTAANAYMHAEDAEIRLEALDFAHQLWLMNIFNPKYLTQDGKAFLEHVPHAEAELNTSVYTH